MFSTSTVSSTTAPPTEWTRVLPSVRRSSPVVRGSRAISAMAPIVCVSTSKTIVAIPNAEIGGQAGGCDDLGGSDGLPRRRCLLRHRTKGTRALPPLRREQGERTSGAVRRRADMLRAARGAIHGNDEQVDGRPCLGGDRHTGTGVRVDAARPDGGSSGPRTRYARARGRNASRPPAVRDIPGVERHGRRAVCAGDGGGRSPSRSPVRARGRGLLRKL